MVITTAMLLGLIAVEGLIRSFSTGMVSFREQPGIVDLSARGQAVRFQFGRPSSCADAQPCAAAPSFDDTAWQEAKLPMPILRTLPDYARGVAENSVIYRLHVVIPEALRASGEQLAFTPMWVNHDQFTVFVDGVRASIFEKDDGSRLLIVTLPVEAAKRGSAVVTIVASIAPTDIGLHHQGFAAIGPARTVNRLVRIDERVNRAYPSMQALPKVVLFLVLAAFWLFGGRQEASWLALTAFACFAALEPLIRSRDATGFLDTNQRYVSFFVVHGMTGVTLGIFLLLHFGRPRWLRAWLPVSTLYAATMAAAAYANYFHGASLPIHLHRAGGALLAAASLLGLAAYCRTAYQSRRRGHQLAPAHAAVAALVAAYAVYLIVSVVFGTFNGIYDRALIESTLLTALVGDAIAIAGRKDGVIAEQRRRLERARVHEAIAMTTRMFAHDVRRPLSLLKSIRVVLQRETDPERLAPVLKEFAQRLDPAIKHAETMIQDLMDGDAGEVMLAEPVPVADVAHEALAAVAALHPNADFEISLDFKHESSLRGSRLKLQRALENVLDNAVQAMNASSDPRPRLWLRTREDRGGGRLELVVGNSGSIIAEADLERIFDPLYTRGKRTGTGLGLAIVESIARGHAGSVSCRSSKALGVEFVFVLPVAAEADDSIRLARSTTLAGYRASQTPLVIHAEACRTRKSAATNAVGATLLPLVAVVDDNAMVLAAWEAVMRDAELLIFDCPREFQAFTAQYPDVERRLTAVITDLYFDNQRETDGDDFARTLRERGFSGKIFLASDSPGALTAALFDGRIAKEPRLWAEVCEGHAGLIRGERVASAELRT